MRCHGKVPRDHPPMRGCEHLTHRLTLFPPPVAPCLDAVPTSADFLPRFSFPISPIFFSLRSVVLAWPREQSARTHACFLLPGGVGGRAQSPRAVERLPPHGAGLPGSWQRHYGSQVMPLCQLFCFTWLFGKRWSKLKNGKSMEYAIHEGRRTNNLKYYIICRCYQEALERQPRDHMISPRVHHSVAETLEAMGGYTDALKHERLSHAG